MNARLALLMMALPLALAGCGNKGPLVLAEKPAAETAPVAPAATEATPATDDAAAPVVPEPAADEKVGEDDPPADGNG